MNIIGNELNNLVKALIIFLFLSWFLAIVHQEWPEYKRIPKLYFTPAENPRYSFLEK